MASLDSEDFAHNQCVRHHGSRIGKDPSESLAGYVHHPCRGFLIQALVIYKPDRLQTFHGENDLFSEESARNTGHYGLQP